MHQAIAAYPSLQAAIFPPSPTSLTPAQSQDITLYELLQVCILSFLMTWGVMSIVSYRTMFHLILADCLNGKIQILYLLHMTKWRFVSSDFKKRSIFIPLLYQIRMSYPSFHLLLLLRSLHCLNIWIMCITFKKGSLLLPMLTSLLLGSSTIPILKKGL